MYKVSLGGARIGQPVARFLLPRLTVCQQICIAALVALLALVLATGVALRFFAGDPEALRATLGAALVLGLLVIGAAIHAVAKKITARLEELQRKVSALGAGDLTVRVGVDSDDELGTLAQAFNRSASGLESMVHAQRSLIANAAHELRSPLARVQQALRLLKAPGPQSAVSEIHRGVRQLDRLVEEVLLASRLESAPSTLLDLSAFDLGKLIREECAPFDAIVDCASLTVVADHVMLRRLLCNLLENAARAGGSGLIDVSAQAGAGGMLEIRIADRGPAMSGASRERVFQPFYRFSGAEPGTGGAGLGLSIVQSIARLHRGSVYCAERMGGGSVFVVRIPHFGDRELGVRRSASAL